MQQATQPVPVSGAPLWAGRIMSGLAILFLLFDTFIHLTRPAMVAEAFARLEYPLSASVTIGIVELICLALYLIPRASLLGAVLLTGVLGGAIATQLRIGAPAFEGYIFPILVGLFLWGGLWLRDARLRPLIPLRSQA